MSATDNGPKTTRKQWSSCDFCRERKKKCDARERAEEGFKRCSRCHENDADCTFDYAAKKNVIRQARRRQSMAARMDQEPPTLEKMPSASESYSSTSFDPSFCSYASGLVLDANGTDFVYAENYTVQTDSTNNAYPYTMPEHQSLSPPEGTTESVDLLSEKDINDILYPSFSVPPTCTGVTMIDPSAFPEVHEAEPLYDRCDFSAATSALLTPETSPELFQSLMSTKTHSGLDPVLELAMLQEFMTLGYVQFPVLDIDVTFLRYRFSVPTPLPRYLILTLVACGALYSSRRLVKPGIDGRRAQLLFDEARREVVKYATPVLNLDAITALIVISFHWNGEMSSYERDMMASLSVLKIQTLGLHTMAGLTAGRTKREIGVLKYVVWLNFVMDAFSNVIRMSYAIYSQRVPYNGVQIEIDNVTIEDSEAISTDYITGKRNPDFSVAKAMRGAFFNNAFVQLGKVQNKIVIARQKGYPFDPFVKELEQWEGQFFPSLDLRDTPWNYAANAFKGFEQFTPGLTSLNFAWWYCYLGAHYEFLSKHLSENMSPGSSPLAFSPSDSECDTTQEHIRACKKAFMSMVCIFEVLYKTNYIYSLSQVLRCQLYSGGRVLQIFYRNRVKLDDELAVDLSTLIRWEKCLEISELVWGFSDRGIDLQFMNLENTP